MMDYCSKKDRRDCEVSKTVAFSRFLTFFALFLSVNFHSAYAASDLGLADNLLIVSQAQSESSSGLGFSMLQSEPIIPGSTQIMNSNNTKVWAVPGPQLPAGLAAMGLDPVQQAEQACVDLIKSHYENHGVLLNCSPNYTLTASATAPSDPGFSNLWGLNAHQGSDAPSGWEVHTGSSSVVVAVIDTGIEYTHPDLVQNMWKNPGENCTNGVDDDGNGVIDDCYGYNAISNSGNPMDGNGHGTHVAGTIAARGNNGSGVVGINWVAKLMGIKFLGDNGSGSLAAAIQGINYMVMMKNRGVNIRVSNNSWGGGGYSQPLKDAIRAAHNAGIIFVAAAGNSANDNDASPSYPASYAEPNVVAVAAVDSDRNMASFSNYGASSVHIAAPGVSILSTYKGGAYATLSGTSMASPHVAGALALLHAANPSMSNSQLIQRLYESGIPLATLTGLVSTGRMLSIGRALKNQTDPVQPPPGDSVCEYSMEEIAYNPDTSADSAAIVQQGDELNFQSVNLAFAFPFHGRSVGSAVISANGVLYTKNAPASMDYRNSSIAPLNSIAGLHADLKAAASPLGVRYAGNNSKAVFSWYTNYYGQENLGAVRVRTVLHSNGEIYTYFEASTDELFNFVKTRSTIGITGPTQASARVFAFNGLPKNRIAIKYTPNCENDDSGFAIDRFQAKGMKGHNPTSKMGLNGQVAFLADGTGTKKLDLELKLNNYVCPRSLPYEVVNGFGFLVVNMPRFVKSATGILKDGSQTLARATVKGNRSRLVRARSDKVRANSRSALKNVRACNRIAARIVENQ